MGGYARMGGLGGNFFFKLQSLHPKTTMHFRESQHPGLHKNTQSFGNLVRLTQEHVTSFYCVRALHGHVSMSAKVDFLVLAALQMRLEL